MKALKITAAIILLWWGLSALFVGVRFYSYVPEIPRNMEVSRQIIKNENRLAVSAQTEQERNLCKITAQQTTQLLQKQTLVMLGFRIGVIIIGAGMVFFGVMILKRVFRKTLHPLNIETLP